MIRREAGADFFLIPQVAHAALAGRLASHFGDGRFARPHARQAVLTAITEHDAGWPLHDDAPTLNPRGRPLDVFEVKRPTALPIWTASADAAQALDPYAGLLVSLHALSRSIYASSNTTPRQGKPDLENVHERFALNKFQHREIERQEQLRRLLGFPTDVPLEHGLAEPGTSIAEDRILFDFRLLQAMDLISLCLCCTHPPARQTHDVFPAPSKKPIKLRLERDVTGGVHVHPWPFDVRRMEMQVPGRRVPARRYESDAEFRAVYDAAPFERITVSVGP